MTLVPLLFYVIDCHNKHIKLRQRELVSNVVKKVSRSLQWTMTAALCDINTCLLVLRQER